MKYIRLIYHLDEKKTTFSRVPEAIGTAVFSVRFDDIREAINDAKEQEIKRQTDPSHIPHMTILVREEDEDVRKSQATTNPV